MSGQAETVGWGENGQMSESFILPPQTTCARCKREIECELSEQDRPRFQYRVIEVRDLLTNEIRYYHHDCYNQTTKGR